MRYRCKYNPDRDIKKTLPDLALDLENAIATGIVVDTGTVTEANGIEDPINIRGRIRDAFDVIDAQRAFKASVKASVEAAKASASAPVSQPSTEGAQS